ncbi:MAG: FMN-binding protein [Spirochaetales bacterium]|jgi:fumarate reductase flavoprotein subunit|nr:FMN-binding protein [Spirochaetales bacterium]
MKKFGLIVMILTLLTLGLAADGILAQARTTYKPGTYEGAANGFHGEVKVSVTVDASRIVSVTVLSHTETNGIGTRAINALPAAIVTAQGVTVDNVSGATLTSRAIKDAVTAALALARP